MTRGRPAVRCAICLLPFALGIALSGCAARRLNLPSDPGTPFSDYSTVHAQVSAACSGARTVTAELALSGRAAEQRLRGRVVSGFQRPASMRLEGVAPFGPPAFILVARSGEATLLLPRDERVVRGAKAEDILGALTGVALAPADLQAILTGCVTATPRASGGRLHGGGWASIDLDGGAVIYLRRDGATWSVRAARRGDWQIEYPTWQGSFPSVVRLRSDAARVDLAAAISQLEVNADVEAAAFTVMIPADARSLTLEELRASGPLRDQ